MSSLKYNDRGVACVSLVTRSLLSWRVVVLLIWWVDFSTRPSQIRCMLGFVFLCLGRKRRSFLAKRIFEIRIKNAWRKLQFLLKRTRRFWFASHFLVIIYRPETIKAFMLKKLQAFIFCVKRMFKGKKKYILE